MKVKINIPPGPKEKVERRKMKVLNSSFKFFLD